MIDLRLCNDLKQRHADSVVVNQSVVLKVVETLCRVLLRIDINTAYLLNLDSLDRQASLFVEAIKEE